MSHLVYNKEKCELGNENNQEEDIVGNDNVNIHHKNGENRIVHDINHDHFCNELGPLVDVNIT